MWHHIELGFDCLPLLISKGRIVKKNQGSSGIHTLINLLAFSVMISLKIMKMGSYETCKALADSSDIKKGKKTFQFSFRLFSKMLGTKFYGMVLYSGSTFIKV